MINQLLNHIFQGVNRAQMNIGYSQFGIITSVNPTDYTVKVMLQPQEIETGFIPFCTPFYGWVAPPKGGEQCLVLFEGGDNNVPVAALLLYWDNHRAPGVSSPGDTGSGEILLKHSGGSYVKLTSDGKININGQLEINAEAANQITLEAPIINLKGNVIIDGDLTANNGTISMTGGTFTTSQDVVAGTISLKNHVHSGVTTGGDDTGAPVP